MNIIGVSIALLCSLTGGLLYLYYDNSSTLIHLSDSIINANIYSIDFGNRLLLAKTLIHWSLFIIVMLQCLRPAIVAIQFLKLKDYKYVCVSLLIALMLFVSVFHYHSNISYQS